MSDIEIDLERNYAAEDAYITSYPEDLNDEEANTILGRWNVSILDERLERGLYRNLLITDELNPVKMFILPARHTDALRRLRYGIVNSEIINKEDELVVENMEETIRQRVEYGGHINVDTQEITLKYKGINGAIKEYEFLKDKINYHTHPSLINKWGFSPPSETDLKTTVTESHRLNKRIVSLVAAAEGIYVYYLTKELFDFFNTDEGHSKIGSIDDYFKDLKLLLGYVMSGPAGPPHNIRRREEERDSNPFRDDSYYRHALRFLETGQYGYGNKAKSHNWSLMDNAGEVDKKAIGGQSAGWTIVGERGPELLKLPLNSHVVPNHALNRNLALNHGKTTIINMY